MFDLPGDADIAAIATQVYEKGGILSAVCHGTVGASRSVSVFVCHGTIGASRSVYLSLPWRCWCVMLCLCLLWHCWCVMLYQSVCPSAKHCRYVMICQSVCLSAKHCWYVTLGLSLIHI